MIDRPAMVCGWLWMALATVSAANLTAQQPLPQAAPHAAQHPSYLTLQTPTANVPHHPTYGYSPGYAYGINTHAYSYGWFGVKPKPQWSRHFGVNRNYTQWSSR